MIIYTDGSCNGNPGPGGYAVILLDDNENFIDCYSHRESYTTNNRQELKAILYAFLHFGIDAKKISAGVPIVKVYSDSAYAVNCFSDWMFKWEKYNWIKTDRKEPENLDLIQAYFNWWKQGHRIELNKVKGHSNNKWNNLADDLATNRIKVEEVRKIYGK